MTANLCRGRADVESLLAILDEHQPDVVAVQELGHTQSTALERRYSFGLLKPDGRGDGSGLASSIPMTVDTMALPGRSGLHGDARAPWGRISIMGVHLLNPLDAWTCRAPFRGAQVSALCDLLDADPTQRILLGDLNATEAWPAYKRLTQRLDDAVAGWASRTGTTPHRTWARRSGRGRPLRRDHVLAAGLVAEEVRTVPIPGSDHQGVIADLAPDISAGRAPAASPPPRVP